MRINLTRPQFDFVTAPERFPAMVAGFGAGKSQAGVWRALRLKRTYPKQDVAYYLPTYDLVARMALPRFEEILTQAGAAFKINKNDSIVEIENCGKVIMRTMDNPARIVAYEVADSIVDELDTLAHHKAAEVWNKVIARNRQKKPDGADNTVGVVTTPEGFRFVYERWKKKQTTGYRLIRASTASNAANLPEGYIESLRASYPPALLAAYLDGEFVNMASGSVYAEFDRTLNACNTVRQPGEPLHIGMDFNVGNMSATVAVLRDGLPHIVDEISGARDTPGIIAHIKATFTGHAILIYPDSSGGNTSSHNASVSDIALLRAAGFNVLVPSRNPAVKDRVQAVNGMILADGVRRLRVNVDACPSTVEALEKQAYTKLGAPDKTSGFDHLPDALGYFIHYRWPILSKGAKMVRIGGF